MSLRIELNVPRGERQRHFLDFLNSALRTRSPSHSGEAGVAEDGLFKSKIMGQFPIDTAHVPLTWQVAKARDGTLLYLEVKCEDPAVPEVRWQTAVHELVTSVFTAALSDRRQSFFQRTLFYYIGVQLDGEYWLPGYRLAPAFPEDPQPFLMNAERPLVIDMMVNAIDWQNAASLVYEATRRHASHLSLLLNVGLYSVPPEHRWVIPITSEGPVTESVRLQLGFFQRTAALNEMPKKGKLCALGKYTGSLAARYKVAGQLLSLPAQSRRILRGVNSADPIVADVFDRGARLYQVASVIGRQFPSAGLAYRIAAVEAIAKGDPTATSFAGFMRKHITSTADLDELLDYMYGSVRSAHFHGGEFPLGEFNRFPFSDTLMDSEEVERSMIHQACYELTREAIVNWMELRVRETGAPDPDSGRDDLF